MDYMEERLGSWQVGSSRKAGKVKFRVFFPNDEGETRHNIKSILATGDFQTELGQAAWDFTNTPALTKASHPEGEIWNYETPTDLEAGFYEYKYYITFNAKPNDHSENPRRVSNPCAQ